MKALEKELPIAAKKTFKDDPFVPQMKQFAQEAKQEIKAIDNALDKMRKNLKVISKVRKFFTVSHFLEIFGK